MCGNHSRGITIMAFRSRSKKIGRNGNITTGGQVQKAGLPAFRALGYNATTTQTGTVVFNTESFDSGGDFDLANNRFVAPVDGIYLFWFQGLAGNNGANIDNDLAFYINGTVQTGCRVREDGPNANWNSIRTQANFELSANDQVDVRVTAGAVYNNHNIWTSFQGFLIG